VSLSYSQYSQTGLFTIWAEQFAVLAETRSCRPVGAEMWSWALNSRSIGVAFIRNLGGRADMTSKSIKRMVSVGYNKDNRPASWRSRLRRAYRIESYN